MLYSEVSIRERLSLKKTKHSNGLWTIICQKYVGSFQKEHCPYNCLVGSIILDYESSTGKESRCRYAVLRVNPR